jgi:peptidoglycan/LPS O-acetylase OafA/YrhL
MGVDLFFVLSGFLVGGLLVQELMKTGTIDVKRFLARRMLKIWPAYYFYVIFQIVIRRHPLNTFWWQNLLNIQNYAGTSLDHTWSLAVEEHFYLLLPFMLLWIYQSRYRSRLEPVLIAACGMILCGRIITYSVAGVSHMQWRTHDRVDSLLFGVLLAHMLYSSKHRFARIVLCRLPLCVLSILVFVISFFESHAAPYMATFGYTANYIGFGALMLLLYGYDGWIIHTKPYKLVVWIGRYSYGIYLWHLSVRTPLEKLAHKLPPSCAWIFLFAMQYVAAILLGAIATKLIELPMLKIRDRLFPRGVAQPPPHSALVEAAPAHAG